MEASKSFSLFEVCLRAQGSHPAAEGAFVMKLPAYCSLSLALALTLSVHAFSQKTIPQDTKDTVLGTSGIHIGEAESPVLYTNFGSALRITVLRDNGSQLDRQAVVALKRPGDAKGYWQATDTKSQATFVNLIPGTYNVEVAAVGYLPERVDYVVNSAVNSYRLEVTLRTDPTSIDLSAPLAIQTSPKARKATERGLRSLKSGLYKQAQKDLDKAYKLEPSNSDVNRLLGYLYAQQGDGARALSHLEAAVASDARNAKTLTLIARLHLQQKDNAKAVPFLEQAVASDAEYWLAHHLLSIAYLQQRAFEKAEQQARLALVTGKGAAQSSLLPLGQALAGLGRYSEARQTLSDYLQNVTDDSVRRQVKGVLDEIEDQIQRGSAVSLSSSSLPDLGSAISSFEDDALRVSMTNWQPTGIDEQKPEIAAGVACPSEEILEKAGWRVLQFVESVSRFAAIEKLQHETVDELGHPLTREIRQYNYLVDISEPAPGQVSVSEFRMTESQFTDFPDQIVTQGLPAMALILHPSLRDTFHFVCEGLGQWHGQAAWLVHFRQREDKPNRIRGYRVNGNLHAVDLKGRAWISADTFHILRVESELVRPRPDIRLLTEHQTVDYGPVAFTDKNAELWLPKTVALYVDFRQRRYIRHHSFDHFMLFSVDAVEKHSAPRATQTSPEPALDRPPSP